MIYFVSVTDLGRLIKNKGVADAKLTRASGTSAGLFNLFAKTVQKFCFYLCQFYFSCTCHAVTSL